ncbi:hypothetical protein GBA52_008131 [Prunus armeniaca]|nr:hypothetical protein GBA52_008131 [Prunus armeniaca]
MMITEERDVLSESPRRSIKIKEDTAKQTEEKLKRMFVGKFLSNNCFMKE